jgi:hypothetical protein
MKTLAALIALFALQLPLISYADDPSGFRDIPFGASMEEVKGKIPRLSCGQWGERRELLDQYCAGETEIADTRVNVQFWFFGNRMGSFALNFKLDQFRLIKEAFIGRYGPPTQSESNEFKTRGGLTYVNEELTWHFKNGANAKLSKYSTGSDQGSGSVRSQEYEDERNRRVEQQLEKAKKGL